MFKRKSKTSSQNPRTVRSPEQSMRSNAVFSYHANRSSYEANTVRDAERKQNVASRLTRVKSKKVIPMVAIGMAFLLLCGVLFRLDSTVKVQAVEVNGGQFFLRDKGQYQRAADAAFSIWFNRNKLTINTNKIIADLKKQFPELQAVSISLPVFGARPVVFIQPVTPRLLLVSRDGIYVIDGNGRALISGNEVAALTELGVPTVTDESNLKLEAGTLALPRSTVHFITEIMGQVTAKGLKPTTITLPAGGSEIKLRLEGSKYFVRFNLHGAAREQVGAFLAVKRQLEEQKKPVPHEYIDVRVENKVYYK